MNINKVRFPRRDFFVNVNENAKFEKQSVKKKSDYNENRVCWYFDKMKLIFDRFQG